MADAADAADTADVRVILADCLEAMRALPEASVDAIVTDPPYGLAFMGKGWDHGVPGVEYWREALRVAKPGAHLVAFGGTRTFHRLACAIEDAGWEVRDCLSWLQGQGFPKSLDVSKALDKAAGAEREVVGTKLGRRGMAKDGSNQRSGFDAAFGAGVGKPMATDITAPATDAARQWQGWGTALKPAWEPIILARKPLVGTVAANVLAHGTGAINVDGCRIGTGEDKTNGGCAGVSALHEGGITKRAPLDFSTGRWPANVALDEEAAAMLDAQTGERSTSTPGSVVRRAQKPANIYGNHTADVGREQVAYGDTGGASRFFYVAKASRSERERGCEHLTGRQQDETREPDAPGANNPRNRGGKLRGNHHPTVKPVALMRWLVRLVTPPDGTVLDPFAGSGTTGLAAREEGFRSILVEREEAYVEIICARLGLDPFDDVEVVDGSERASGGSSPLCEAAE